MIHHHKPNTPGVPALLYHGGPVMQPALRLFIVYWQPATLQSGAATSMSQGYKDVERNMVYGYPGHALAAIAGQYYQQVGNVRSYYTGVAVPGDAPYTDTQPYPVSQCAASIGPNCFTQAQLQTEVQRVINLKGWKAGLNAMFLFFTSSGEGSCFDTTVNYCSTETANVNPYYCAYHSYFGSSPNYIVYSNEPFGNPNYCLGGGTQPNINSGGPQADPAATGASHEMSEAFTDPLLNAWYASDGSENGDLCAYNYGVNDWNNNTANQNWGGHVFELQTEYNNHRAGCSQTGP
jgi:hypothetical protein